MKLTTFSALLTALTATAACGSPDGPDFKSEHPRIFVDANRTRLTTALANKTPAAMRFAGMVDRAVAGEDVYGFSAWNAALMGQLTGDSKYCRAAVAQIDK